MGSWVSRGCGCGWGGGVGGGGGPSVLMELGALPGTPQRNPENILNPQTELGVCGFRIFSGFLCGVSRSQKEN